VVLPKGFAAAMLWQRKPEMLFARVQVAAAHPAKAKKDTGEPWRQCCKWLRGRLGLRPFDLMWVMPP